MRAWATARRALMPRPEWKAEDKGDIIDARPAGVGSARGRKTRPSLPGIGTYDEVVVPWHAGSQEKATRAGVERFWDEGEAVLHALDCASMGIVDHQCELCSSEFHVAHGIGGDRNRRALLNNFLEAPLHRTVSP